MLDINGNEIKVGMTIKDIDSRSYEVVRFNDRLYVKSLFEDMGRGLYVLTSKRIEENRFIIS